MNDYSVHSETVKAFDEELAVLIQKGITKGVQECPPWSRTVVVDPDTGVRVGKGTVGPM